LIRVDNIDYWRTTLPNGKIEYSLRKFDSKRRITLYRSGLTSMTDSTGNFTRFDYDDEKHIETITSSSIGVENKYETIVSNYCDDNWITIKREIIEIHDGVNTLRRFEYTRIK
jgi:YD repeat-containing protein